MSNQINNKLGPTLTLALTISASAVLVGCGGGGNGGSGDASTSEVDPAQATADPRNQKLLVDWDTDANTSYNLFWSTEPSLEPENYASFANSGMAADVQPPYTLDGLENNRNYYLYLESDNGTSGFSERFGTRPTPPAITGAVHAIEQDSQGNLYLGGSFQSVGYSAGGLIALDRDTELPINSPYVAGLVTSIEPDGSGGYYVSGQFEHADNQEVHNIIRLNSDLSLDESWNVTTDRAVIAMVVEADRILLGGGFSEVNGSVRHGLAAIDHDGALLSFSAPVGTAPNYNGAVTDLIVTDDHIIVTGNYSEIAGEARENLAALKSDGSVDVDWQADTNGQVSDVVRNGDRLYITGRFNTVGGSSRIVAAALNINGDVLSFDPEITDGNGSTIAVINDVVYIGGQFEGPSDNLLARDFNGNPVNIGAGEPNGPVTLIREMDGNILVSGIFTEIGNASRIGMALLNGQGELQTNLQTGIQAAYDFHYTGDTLLFGSIVGSNYQNVRRNNLAKLTVNGDIAEWETGLNNQVYTLALADDTLYAGGQFTETDNSVARMHLAAFDQTDGALDNEWTPEADGTVRAMVTRSGEFHIGGEFDSINGTAQANLSTLDANNQLVGHMPEPTGSVTSITQDGINLYIAGSFLFVDSSPRDAVAAVDSTNGDLLDWAPSLTESGPRYMQVNAIEVFSGKVYLGGRFDEAEGSSRLNLASYDTAGNLLPWQPDADGGTDSRVHSLLANSNGIQVSGHFEQIGGDTANMLARVDSDGNPVAALDGGTPPAASTMTEVEGGFCLSSNSSFIINQRIGGGIACLDDDLNWLW